MNSPISQVAALSPTTGNSGVVESQPSKANAAVQRPARPENSSTVEASALMGLRGRTSPVADEPAVEEIVEGLNEYAQRVERELQFTIDKDSGETVIKVIDVATKETVRQIPAAEVLEMRKRLGEVAGLLFNTQA